MRPFPKWLLWGSSLATGLTGAVYWWMKNVLEASEPWAVVNHPLQPWVLKAHIVVAPLMVFAFGLIAGEHVWRYYRARVRAGRRSGGLAALVFGPLVLSGYLIQAITAPLWLAVVVWVHVAAGVLYGVGLVLHHRVFRGLSGSRLRRESPEGAGRPGRAFREPPRAEPLARRPSRQLTAVGTDATS